MTIKYPNQINQIPIIPNDQSKPRYLNRLIDRSTILSNDPKIQIPTFYGPGQSPDAGEPNLYVPPTDWSIPNSLLTMPQVVWLYLNQGGAMILNNQQFYPVIADSPHGGHFIASFSGTETWRIQCFQNGSIGAVATVQASDFSGNPITFSPPQTCSLGTWIRAPSADKPFNFQGTGQPAQAGYSFSVGPIGPLLGFFDVYQAPPLPLQTLPNIYTDEYSRLKTIYQEAQTILTKLRPGRTWANIIDPFNNIPSPNPYFVPGIYFGDPGNDNTYNYPQSPPLYFPNQPVLYYPMLTPSTTNPYLGIDFLYIFTATPDTTEIHITNDYDDPEEEFNEFTFVQLARNNSLQNIGNVANFRRYSFKYYGMSMTMPQFQHVTLESALPPDYTINAPNFHIWSSKTVAAANPEIGSVASSWWQPFPLALPPPIGILPIDNSAYGILSTANQNSSNISIDNINNINIMNQQLIVDQLITDGRDLTGLGIDAQYIDGTPAIDSTATLIKIIANHYNFDPDTGKDL